VTIHVTFELITTNIVVTAGSVATGGTVNPSGIQTGSPGSTREFTATPAEGWHVSSWGGTAVGASECGANNTCTVTFQPPTPGAANLWANFTRNTTAIIYDINPVGSGVVGSSGAEGLSGGNAFFSAVPLPGWHFTHWSGHGTGTSTSLTIARPLGGNHATGQYAILTANFARNQTTITPSIYPVGAGVVALEGSTSMAGVQTAESGSTSDFIAIPADGWLFVGWSWEAEDLSPWPSNLLTPNTTATFPRSGNGELIANFARNQTGIHTSVAWSGLVPPVYGMAGSVVITSGTAGGDSGGDVTFRADPASGWQFSHWSGHGSGSTNPATFQRPMGPNLHVVTLTANFVRVTTTITATSTIGGSVTPSGESGGLSGTTETFIAAPNTGFYFSGWSRTTGGPIFSTTNPFTDTRPDSGTVYLIANFTGFTGTVRFDRGSHAGITPTGNVPADQTRQSGQAWLSAGTHNLTIPGRHIVGWYTAAVGGFRVLDTDGTVVANPPDLIVPIVGAVVTLHARWSENTGTVRFNANVISTDLHPVLGNVPTSLTDSRATTGYTWTSNIQVSSEFRRIGFILAGWYTTASGEGARIFNANGTPVVGAPSLVMPTQGGYFDLFARWTANTGNLRFLPNAPTGPVPGPMPTQIVYTTANQLPASVALPGNFGRAHYWFLGFYDSPTGGTRIFVPNCFAAPGIPCNPSTLVLDGDPRHLAVVGGFTDLYARWAPAIWRADFDIREATSTQPSVQYLQSNETVTRPPDPVHPAGHSFVRWERQDRLGVEFNFDEPITSNVTLVAIFTPHVDIVIFNEQGGRGSVPYVPFTWGNPITAPPSPTRVGFVFSHWSLEQATETTPMPPRFNFATQIFYRMELFAVWIPSEHTVRIQWNDESGNIVYTEFIVSHGETIPSQNRPSNPTYPPYGIAEDARFLHWSMTPNGNHAFDFESTAVTRSFTLYAVWTRVEFETEAGLN